MNIDSIFEKVANRSLYKILSKLDVIQFKMFYSIFVHYWTNHKHFISNKNFSNLWCELNQICHEVDETFPDPYDDHNLIKSYCQEHPFYFIDILDLETIINLFCEHCDDNLDTLIQVIYKLNTEGLRAAYACANEAFDLDESVDELVTETTKYLKRFT